MSKNRAVRLGEIVERRQRTYDELLAELQGEREREAHRNDLKELADSRTVKTFYLRVMNDEERRKGIALAEVIDGEIVRLYARYYGTASWRDLHLEYTRFVESLLNDDQVAEVMTNCKLATNRKTQRFKQVKYEKNDSIKKFSVLNNAATYAIIYKVSEELGEYGKLSYKKEES